MCDKQHHQKVNGKLTLKHNCQVKCLGSGFFMSGCDKPKNDKKTFQLTQDWLDYLVKYKYSKGDLRCLDCEIETIKRDINLTSNDQKISKLKEKLVKLEQQERSSKSYWPWIIGGGIILVLLVGGIIYFLTRNKKKIK